MKRMAVAAAIIVGSTVPTWASDVLSRAEARKSAVEILRGDPYGESSREVLQNIRLIQFVSAGVTRCGRFAFPVWQIHVVVPKERLKDRDSKIDGWLVLDARTGKVVCARLPFLESGFRIRSWEMHS
jgi:hypothetical protein